MRAWGGVGDGVVVLPHPPAIGGVFRPPAADFRLLTVAVSSDSGRQLFSLKVMPRRHLFILSPFCILRCNSVAYPRVRLCSVL